MELQDDPRVQVGAYISRGGRLFQVERTNGEFVVLENVKSLRWARKRMREITLGGYRLVRASSDIPE